MTRQGIVAIMGRPNAGKSTLLNALVGQKLAAVSAKPQTTRGRIRGIVTTGEAQLLFCDTPGLHRQQRSRALNSMMNREAWSGIRDADVGLYLVSIIEGFRPEDTDFLKGVLAESGAKPLLLFVSQADRKKKKDALARLRSINAAAAEALGPELWAARGPFRFLSAKRPEDLAALKEEMAALVPEGPWLFPADEVSDQPTRQVAAELIRENLFRTLGEEVPYQATVVIEEWDEEESGMIRISAAVIVARASLKPLVIGKAGSKIKEIGTRSRLTLEHELNTKVFLELHVIVSANWMEDEGRVREFHDLD